MKQAITKATDELLAVYLNKGVQVSDLSDNIFDYEYNSFAVSKKNDSIVATLAFTEELDECTQVVTMRYTYDASRFLLRVEQKISSSRFTMQWCRETAISDGVAKLARILEQHDYTGSQLTMALSTLPKDLTRRLKPYLKAVA